MLNILELPNEILLNILSYLSNKDRQILSLVCKKFQLLANDIIFKIEHISIGEGYWEDEDIINKICLKSLLIEENTQADKLVKLALKYCGNLKKIDLSRNGLMSDCVFQEIKSLGKSLRKIHFNEVINGQILERNASCLFRLREIQLRECNINNESLIAIAKHCKLLDTFIFIPTLNSSVSDEGFKEIFIQCLKLKSLSFHGNFLTDRSYKYLKKLQLLKSLKIIKAISLNKEGLKSISSLPHLNSLILMHNNSLNENDFIEAFSLDFFKKLNYLDLSDCKNVNSNVLSTIGKNGSELLVIKLVSRNNSFEEESIKIVLENCLKLKRFYLLNTTNCTREVRNQINEINHKNRRYIFKLQ